MAWHQLTYASSDVPPGGWQVLGQSADLPDAVREQLRSRVVTRLVEVTPTDEFASQAELEARPRRLAFEPVPEGLAWWHAARAGKDATGRPGNVFTHAALLAGPAGSLRPMDLWRSPDWLAPFGTAEVGAARLGDFGRTGPLDRAAAAAWLLEHAEQLEPLVAAVSWLLAEPRRHVVLAAGTADEFAAWVAAATHLTAPAIARRIPFVTFERVADGGTDLPASGFVGVPAADVPALDKLRREGALVLELGRLPEDPVDGPGDRYWEHDGQRWPVDPVWQDAVYGASGLSREELERVLATMDEITAPLGDEALVPGWPLALAMLEVAPRRLQDRDELVERWQRTRPWSGLRHPGLLAVLDQARAVPPTVPAPAPEPTLDPAGAALLEAATRLLDYAAHATYVERSAVQRCVHLMLVHGLPKKPDQDCVRRAEAWLALGDALPPAVRELLEAWAPTPEGSRRG